MSASPPLGFLLTISFVSATADCLPAAAAAEMLPAFSAAYSSAEWQRGGGRLSLIRLLQLQQCPPPLSGEPQLPASWLQSVSLSNVAAMQLRSARRGNPSVEVDTANHAARLGLSPLRCFDEAVTAVPPLLLLTINGRGRGFFLHLGKKKIHLVQLKKKKKIANESSRLLSKPAKLTR